MTPLSGKGFLKTVLWDLSTVVPRERHTRTVRALETSQRMLHDEQARTAHLRSLVEDERRLRLLAQDAQRLTNEAWHAVGQEIMQVRVALGRVAVYQGIVEHSPTAMLVDELVRDHEELEARIEAALVALGDDPASKRIEGLLRGAERVPDTVEEALGDPGLE